MYYVRAERAAAASQIERSLKAWRKAAGPATAPVAIPKAGGAPLDSAVRGRMEKQLGADLSGAKIHTGGESSEAAKDIGARAFTVGQDVHFGSGEFAPGTKEGDRLIAHELTHVVQGQKGGVQRKAESTTAGEHEGAQQDVSHPSEPAEQEADRVADGVADRLHDHCHAKRDQNAGTKPGQGTNQAGGDAASGEKGAGGAHADATAKATGEGAKDGDKPAIAAAPPALGRKMIFRAASTAPAAKPGLLGRLFGGGKKAQPPAQVAEQLDPLVKNVRELLDRPIPPETKQELEKQYKALDKAAADLRKAIANADPALVKQAEAEVDAIRVSASGTAQGKHGVAVGGGNAAQLAQANWQKASAMVRGWAAAKVPISIDGLQKINETLGAGLDNNGGAAGEVRKRDVMTMTATGAPNPYLPSKTVPGELAAAVAWYQSNRTKMKGPDLAAKMYQRLVSIHPFMDGNGRTCRLAMDWVLLSHGLPPAAMQGEEVNVAVFGLDKLAGRPSVEPGHAEQAVVAGIKRTIDIMKRVIQQAK